jgi:ATP-dependent DNA ligase
VPVHEPPRGERWALRARVTAAKIKGCRRLKPVLVGHFEFVDWTEDAHLRHSRFVALREDKMKAKDVSRES